MDAIIILAAILGLAALGRNRATGDDPAAIIILAAILGLAALGRNRATGDDPAAGGDAFLDGGDAAPSVDSGYGATSASPGTNRRTQTGDWVYSAVNPFTGATVGMKNIRDPQGNIIGGAFFD